MPMNWRLTSGDDSGPGRDRGSRTSKPRSREARGLAFATLPYTPVGQLITVDLSAGFS